MIDLREHRGLRGSSDRAAAMVEYALLVTLIAVPVAVLLPSFAGAIGGLLDFAWP